MKLMLVLLWLSSAGALALAVLHFLHKEWSQGALLVVIGAAVIGMTVWSLRLLGRIETPLEATAPGQIVMRVAGGEVANTLYWALGFLISAVAVVHWPDVLWTRWLAYPAGLVLLALVGVMVLITISQRLERVVADPQGIEVRTEMRGMASADTKVAWRQVGAVKRVAVYGRRGSKQPGPDPLLRREFVLLDREGKELLNIGDPLDPPDHYQRFLAALPAWTGLAVQEERVTK